MTMSHVAVLGVCYVVSAVALNMRSWVVSR